jgi:hypothetical protein
MGCIPSKPKVKFQVIPDNYKTYEDVTAALQTAGLESANLIMALDMSKSCTWTGKASYGCGLHDMAADGFTAFSRIIHVVGNVLADLDDDKIIPCFRFGDVLTTDRSVLPLEGNDPNFRGIEALIEAYHRVMPTIQMSGPTTMAPAIQAACDIVRTTQSYHILLIFTDGDISSRARDAKAVIAASHLPLSIIVVGLGDGPFEILEEFDDHLPSRVHDNLQFVNATELEAKLATVERPDLLLALHLLMEVPEQYRTIKKLGMLDENYRPPRMSGNRL